MCLSHAVASDAHRERARRWIPVLLVLVLGTAVALFAHRFARHQEEQRIAARFATAARDRYLSLRATVAQYVEQVESLAEFYASTPDFNRQSYRRFVQPRLARHTGISSLEWIPRVPHEERAAYEARARKDGFPEFHFTRRVRQGVMGVVEPRAEYYPVYYQEPLVGNGIALGFDLGTNPARLDALTQAMESGRPAATARVILVEETAGRYSVLLLAPIYHTGRPLETPQARRDALACYGLGVFRIGDLVEEALRQLEPQAITITLYDDSAPSDEHFLYHSPFTSTSGSQEEAARAAERSPLTVSNTLDVGGRSWRMVAAATPEYLAARRTWQPFLLSLAIFCLTLVVAGWMWAEIHRRARVEALASALQQSNEDLQQSYRELQQSNEERLRAQEALRESEHRLLQGQKMESIGRLAGGVAHDFNNLLTAIFSYLESAMMKLPADGPARADLGRVQESAERAANLTRQLLAFARKQPNVPRVLRLDLVAMRLEPLLRRLVGEDVELIFDAGADLGHVRVDPGQLEMVLVNLVVNARDAMPGGGRLTIKTANVTLDEPTSPLFPGATPGEQVMLAVTDTGTGMSEDVVTQIFEPFFTTKAPGKGTGLGLSTCMGVVQQNGGQLRVESTLGQGTTFRLYFPRVYEPNEPPHNFPPVAAPLPGGSETVMVVEDEPLVRGIAHEFLKARGYLVLDAGDGEEGLRMARAHNGPIDLLITDLVMPRMGGREMVKALRPERPDLKVIYVSGYAEASNYRVPGDCVAFLQKPFTLFTLARTVREALDTKNRRDISKL